MRILEFLDRVTAYIGDPATRQEVRLELQAHLEEAVAEATQQGLDPASAELIAVGRMGSAEDLAMQLAAAHHTHLPWRLYLAPIPALGLLLVPDKFGPWVSVWLWGTLCFALAPTRTAIKRWLSLLYIDGVAKYEWVKRQPLRAALISGGVSGLVAGLAFSLTPILGRVVYTSGWYEAYVPRMVWGVLGELSWLAIAFPLVPGFVALITARRFFNGNWALTGAFAALAFPIGSFPSLSWLVHAGGPMIWPFFNVAFAVFALLAGYMAHRRERPLSVGHP